MTIALDSLDRFMEACIFRYMAKYKNALDEMMPVFKALADENRARALLALQDGELCVCQIIELLKLAPSTVSKHMSILKQAGLVESRKCGRWIYYKLPQAWSVPESERWIELLIASMANDGRIQQDRAEVKKILRLSPDDLCKKQSECKPEKQPDPITRKTA